MNDIVNDYHKKHRKETALRERRYREAVPPIRCNDGFSISVQASEFTYCSPPVTEDCEYTQFECGFPSGPVPELAEWKEGDGADEGTVYGYVPVEVIVQLIEKHGGIADQPATASVAS